MKNIPTEKEKEEMKRPTVENFQRLLDSLMNYNEIPIQVLLSVGNTIVLYDSSRAFYAASFEMVKMVVGCLNLMLRLIFGWMILVSAIQNQNDSTDESKSIQLLLGSVVVNTQKHTHFITENFVHCSKELILRAEIEEFDFHQGIYTDLATASTHIIEKSVSHKSYLTKEAAEKALEESYKIIATEETQKSEQFVSLNQHLQSQTKKLNAFNRMKNIPTAKEKEEMRRPTVENFQRILDSLMNYNEVHATMLFYPKKRRNIGPKAVFMPEASPKDIYDYYVHGLVDTIYINGETLKELQEFPLKVQDIIKGYKEVFAKGRELFLKIRSSYPIFDKEQKHIVPSIIVAQLGVSNKGYPEKDEKIECAPPTIEDLVYSFMEVLVGSSKIGIGPRHKDKIKINYCSKNLLIYSKFQERIDEVQLKVLSDFEDQIELFSGLLAPLPEDLKQKLCSYMTRNTRHHCYYCSEGTSSSPIMEG
uniref:Enzymatic polyprotein n=1 Tax=Tanacetum cinerariifolium TaxID=118510 RepID=A0A6L2P3Q7_TANCI|nr:enzymatic polyprotein [Tanacetum cinerariifolium]